MGLINVDIRIERNKIKRLRNCEAVKLQSFLIIFFQFTI